MSKKIDSCFGGNLFWKEMIDKTKIKRSLESLKGRYKEHLCYLTKNNLVLKIFPWI